jgi:hypothetical protein
LLEVCTRAENRLLERITRVGWLSWSVEGNMLVRVCGAGNGHELHLIVRASPPARVAACADGTDVCSDREVSYCLR